MLSTVQVGITSIGLLNGIVGEAAFAAGVATQLQSWGAPEAVARPIATFSVVVVLAYITLIFGEMVPKRIGLLYPEVVARWVARPMNFLATATAPFIRLISWSTETMLRLLRILAAAAVPALACLSVRALPPFWMLCAGATIFAIGYPLALWVLRGLEPGEVDVVRGWLRRLRRTV